MEFQFHKVSSSQDICESAQRHEQRKLHQAEKGYKTSLDSTNTQSDRLRTAGNCRLLLSKWGNNESGGKFWETHQHARVETVLYREEWTTASV